MTQNNDFKHRTSSFQFHCPLRIFPNISWTEDPRWAYSMFYHMRQNRPIHEDNLYTKVRTEGGSRRVVKDAPGAWSRTR
jgi:hypothetical protein